MAQKKNTMMDPPIETLLECVDSKFTLVTLAATRGRQINSYFNQLGEGLGTVVPPQVSSVSRKPLSIALEEIAARKIVCLRPEDEVTDEESAGDEPASSGAPTLESIDGTADANE